MHASTERKGSANTPQSELGRNVIEMSPYVVIVLYYDNIRGVSPFKIQGLQIEARQHDTCKVARKSQGNLAANEMLNESVVSNSVKPSGITVCCWEVVLPYYILQAVICN